MSISLFCFEFGYQTIDHLDIETIHHENSQTHLYRLRVRQAVTKTRFVYAKVLKIFLAALNEARPKQIFETFSIKSTGESRVLTT